MKLEISEEKNELKTQLTQLSYNGRISSSATPGGNRLYWIVIEKIAFFFFSLLLIHY